jgi:ribonuclease HII
MMLKNKFSEDHIEIGCDEAGRGCLAGPVHAAAVILPVDFHHPLLNDSKKMSPKNREELRKVIEQEAVEFAVGSSTNHEIDKLNILNASIATMHKALDQIKAFFDLVLVDGNRFHPYKSIKHQCIIEGDGQYLSIAAASILAKTYRDEYMRSLDAEYPQYDWCNNKGYATPRHRDAIIKNGLSPYHRRSFHLNFQTKMDF